MITDEIMDAIDMLMELCKSEEQKKGMKAVQEMLGDFDQNGWTNMEQPSDCYEWLERYLP